METLKKPDVATNESSGLSNNTGGNCSKRPTKREMVLAWLIDKSERGFKVTRFDAEHIGDHCLNSTVSEIEHLDGVRISRKKTKRPTRFNKAIDCNEYWIAESELMNARKALTVKQARRAA